MFKVGDFVKGTKGAPYGITNEHMKKGEVIYACGGSITVKVAEHDEPSEVGRCYGSLESKYFAPYQNESITINYTGDVTAAHKELTEKIKALSIRKATPERIQKAKDLIAEITLDLIDGNPFYAYPVYLGDSVAYPECVTCQLKRPDGVKRAVATCADGDEPNVWIGRAVALCKAVGRKLTDWV